MQEDENLPERCDAQAAGNVVDVRCPDGVHASHDGERVVVVCHNEVNVVVWSENVRGQKGMAGELNSVNVPTTRYGKTQLTGTSKRLQGRMEPSTPK